MEIIKDLISINYTAGKVINPEYIVIHETANRSKGADAMAHRRYFGTNKNAKASAHFVVDDKRAIQLGEFEKGKCYEMWHVGTGKFKNPIYNKNSIGIEICVNSDGDYNKAFENAVTLCRHIMEKTGIDSAHVVRHFDAWGKRCPATMLEHPQLWEKFKNEVSKPTFNEGENAPRKCRHFAQSYKKGVIL